MSRTVTLRADTAARRLPDRLFGMNSEVAYVIPHEDPAMIPPARELAPGYLRFPSGTVSNYWEWRSGQLIVPPIDDPPPYRKMLTEWAPLTRLGHLNGCSAEHFTDVATQIGAEVIFTPNLDTSTVEEQTAWVVDMKSKGVLPRRIEMGNEFYIAGIHGQDCAERFPDVATTLRITKEYSDAFQPYLEDDALIAVQSAGSRVLMTEDPGEGHGFMGAPVRGIWTWDEELEAADWFQAVTLHMYPDLDAVAGPGTSVALPGAMDRAYPAILAQAEEGTHRGLKYLEAKVPGKEIWVTEWGIGVIADFFAGRAPVFNGMWWHFVARTMLTYLRHPSVTVACYHAFFFSGDHWSTFRADPAGDGYLPMGPNTLLSWFHHAAHGGADYAPLDVVGARRVPGGGLRPQAYADVEGAVFRRAETTTVLMQNTGDAVEVDVSAIASGAVPTKVETSATPDLARAWHDGCPPVELIEPAATVTLPARSVTRFMWEG